MTIFSYSNSEITTLRGGGGEGEQYAILIQ